jgi:hypothetical protein
MDLTSANLGGAHPTAAVLAWADLTNATQLKDCGADVSAL